MENIIQKLVEIDRECVKRVEAAKAKKYDAKTAMSGKRSEIYEEFILEQKQQIEKHKAELLEKNSQDVKNQEKEYFETMNKMETLYQDNKEKWINEIVERCLK